MEGITSDQIIGKAVWQEVLGESFPRQRVKVRIPLFRETHAKNLGLLDENYKPITADVQKIHNREVEAVFYTELQAGEIKTVYVAENMESIPSISAERTEKGYRVSNGSICAEVPGDGYFFYDQLPAPLLSLTCHGETIAAGSLRSKSSPQKVRLTTVVSKTPVEAVIMIRYEKEDDSFYQAKLTLGSEEDNLLIEEYFSGFDSQFRLDFVSCPDYAFGRMHAPLEYKGKPDIFQRISYTVRYDQQDEIGFQPFYVWDKNCSTVMAFSSEHAKTAIGIVPIRASKWENGQQNRVWAIADRQNDQDCFFVQTEVKKGARNWLIACKDRKDFFRHTNFAVTSTYQTFGYIRNIPIERASFAEDMSSIYNGMSLTRYLQMPRFPNDLKNNPHPCLLVTPETRRIAQKNVQSWEWLRSTILAHKDDPDGYDPAGIYLALGDPAYAQKAKSLIIQWLQERLWQIIRMGYAFHENVCIRLSRPLRLVAIDYDLIVDAGCFSDEERCWIENALSFLMVCMQDPDYWPDRNVGFSKGNANFHSDYFSTLGILGCLLQWNPDSQAVLDYVEKQIEQDLEQCVAKSGAWNEAPNYQAYSMNYYSALFTALKYSGRRDYYTDSRFLKALDFLADLQTPVDPRSHIAHLPTIGDTAVNYWSQSFQNIFAIAAFMTRDSNPDFSRRMLRTWQRAGKIIINVGGEQNSIFKFSVAYLSPEFHVQLFGDFPWESHWYEDFGAVMKSRDANGFPDGYLLFKGGKISQHYDHDEGSLIWYAKGAPLLCDIGGQYFPSCDPTFLHNRLSFDHKTDQARGKMTGFYATSHTDFADLETVVIELQPWSEWPVRDLSWNFRYEKPAYSVAPIRWIRNVIYLKDEQALFLRDKVEGDTVSEMNFLSYTTAIHRSGDTFLLDGQFGVDMTVSLFSNQPYSAETYEWEYAGLDEPMFFDAFRIDWRKLRWVWEKPIKSMGEKVGILRIHGGKGQVFSAFLRSEQSELEVEYRQQGQIMECNYPDHRLVVVCGSQTLEYRHKDFSFVGKKAVFREKDGRWTADIHFGEKLTFRGREYMISQGEMILE